MDADILTTEDQLVTELIERMNGAGDGPSARDVFREGFERLRSQLEIYPVSGRRASVIFESAAKTARSELCYIKSQPTADDIILRSTGA
jgi:hypothetical protein